MGDWTWEARLPFPPRLLTYQVYAWKMLYTTEISERRFTENLEPFLLEKNWSKIQLSSDSMRNTRPFGPIKDLVELFEI